MDAESIRNYALSLGDNITESFPFDEETLVFKANGKMFLLMALDEHPLTFNVKCDPDQAIEWRENYPDTVLPGYHMNKKHWNTIIMNGALTPAQIKEMIENSYHLIVR